MRVVETSVVEVTSFEAVFLEVEVVVMAFPLPV